MTRDGLPDATNWLKVVAILQAAFSEGTLAKECTCQTVTIIPKVKGYLRGIGIVHVLWKSVASLINRQIMAEISFHDTLHGFRMGWGTDTAALEAKLLQHIMAMRRVVLFNFFLDIRKAYNDLD